MEVEIIGMGVEEEGSSTPNGWFQEFLHESDSFHVTHYLL